MSISYIVAHFVEIDPKWPNGNPDILTPLVENGRGFNTYFLRSEKKIPLHFENSQLLRNTINIDEIN